MDNTIITSQFDAVERKVDQLLGAYATLQKENTELLEKIERLEQEITGKSEAIAQYVQERDLIRIRIDGLLARLGEPPKEAVNESV